MLANIVAPTYVNYVSAEDVEEINSTIKENYISSLEVNDMTNQISSQIKLSTGEAEVFGNMDSVSFTNAEFIEAIEASGTDINEYFTDEHVQAALEEDRNHAAQANIEFQWYGPSSPVISYRVRLQ